MLRIRLPATSHFRSSFYSVAELDSYVDWPDLVCFIPSNRSGFSFLGTNGVAFVTKLCISE